MENLKKKFHFYLLALTLGLMLVGVFAIFDLNEIDRKISLTSMLEVIKSKNIYSFGLFFFPSMSVLMTHLFLVIKNKNKTLKSEFDFTNTILNAAPDAIIFLDENLKINFKNYQFKAMFENEKLLLEQLQLNKFISHTKFYQKEYFLDSNIQKDHPFLVSIRLTIQNDKKNYFISLKDLKGIKDKEEIIENQKIQMIEKNKLASLGEMAAGIAHEVNNPLTVINSTNHLIAKMLDKPEISRDKIVSLTRKNLEQVNRISDIINSLRNLSRGMANTELESFSFKQVIEEAFQLAKIKDQSKNIKLINKLDGEYEVYANRGQIVQVVLNLFNNAIDAIQTQDEPWIEISADKSVEFFNFYIKDSGLGIPRNIQNKVFEPMFTTKDVGKGTGLGLSISKSFVENNAGFLLYDDQQKNTCFILSLKPAVFPNKQSA